MNDKIEYIRKDRTTQFKIESWSGAATKIGGYIGMITELIKKPNSTPDIIIGTSSGAIASLLRVSLMVNPLMLPHIIKLAIKLSLDDIFNISPVNKKGGLRGSSIVRLIRGKLSMGEHYQLTKTLKKLFTEHMYNEYRRIEHRYPDLLICSTDIDSGKFIVVNAKDLSYEDIFKHILASTSIPLATQPMSIGGNLNLDAGITFGNPGCYLIHKMIKGGYTVRAHNSFYSRPQDISGSITEKVEVLRLKDRLMFKGASKIVSRVVDLMLLQNSKSCEWLESYQSEKQGYELQQVFIPKILDSTYDVDEDQLKELYEAGKRSLVNFK
tara:strand:+ start:376 stop:1350 length:975 start_codon:yes stop_codon:yes gene_type:complete